MGKSRGLIVLGALLAVLVFTGASSAQDEPTELPAGPDTPGYEEYVDADAAAASAADVAPDVLAASQSAEVQGDAVEPSLTESEGGFIADGTLTTVRLSGDADGSISIGEGDHATTLLPGGESPYASEPEVVNGDSVLFANVSPFVDRIVRPTATGVAIYTQIRSWQAADLFTWEIDLEDGESLQQIDDHTVAVVRDVSGDPDPELPAASEFATQVKTEPVAADDATEQAQSSEDPAAQFDAASDALAASANHRDGEVVVDATIRAPWAIDASGTSVPLSLSVDPGLQTVTMHVAHKGGGFDYPILADPESDDCDADIACRDGQRKPKCNDNKDQDNDQDSLVDYPDDPGCTGLRDDSELNVCEDAKDNDLDGKVDLLDPGCSGRNDMKETSASLVCDNGLDDETQPDGHVDWPEDPGCGSLTDGDEYNSWQCSDGIDNDNDGTFDWQADNGCGGQKFNQPESAENFFVWTAVVASPPASPSGPVDCPDAISLTTGYYDRYEQQQVSNALQTLKADGVNCVILTPQMFMKESAGWPTINGGVSPSTTRRTLNSSITDNSTELARYSGKQWTSAATLHMAAEKAYDLGLKVVVKPHVDSLDGTARQFINPPSNVYADFNGVTRSYYDEWWREYQLAMNIYAATARNVGAEAFVIGTELTRLSDDSSDNAHWITVLNGIRNAYPGPIGFAANWDQGLRPLSMSSSSYFFKQLDFVGVDAYFPVASTNDPTRAQIQAAWGASAPPSYATCDSELSHGAPALTPSEQVECVRVLYDTSTTDVRVLLSELGYQSTDGTAQFPYHDLAYDNVISPGTHPVSQQDQQDAIAAGSSFWQSWKGSNARSSWFDGIWWWHAELSGADAKAPGDYTLPTKQAMGEAADFNLCTQFAASVLPCANATTRIG